MVAPADVGGLERVVFALTAGLLGRGRPAHILAFVDAGQADHSFVAELRDAGVPHTAAPLPHRAYRAERARLRAVAGEFGATVVHTHGARVDVVDLPAARRDGFATVSTLHGFTGADLKFRFYEWLQCRIVRRADCVVGVSRPIVERLVASGVPAERVRLLRNAWSPNGEFLPREQARAALRVPAVGLRVGWLGRLTHEKGPDVLVEAAGRLTLRGVALSVLGEGRERPRLEARARALGIGDRVTWHGTVRGGGRLVRAFDVLVLSSRSEGTPVVLFEAMAAGVPVVATAVGGVPDVVSPGEALLVPPEDPAALAAGIETALRDSAAAARRVAAASARLARDFAVDPWLDAYEAVYREVLDRRAARQGNYP